MENNRLFALYNQISKHSHYQILAKPLQDILPLKDVKIFSRFEQERLQFILETVPYMEASLADIGGNTGYFTFELISRGAKSAWFIEGNSDHSAFVQEAVQVLKWEDKIKVFSQYIHFERDIPFKKVDICLLLNVLHHVGDDYGEAQLSIEAAKQNILTSLAQLAEHSNYLVFQLGFNWQGNKNLPLFKHGTKAEMIEFIQSGSHEHWVIEHIGIAEAVAEKIIYKPLTTDNIKRQDELGEFLNRPLFIMRSKHNSYK